MIRCVCSHRAGHRECSLTRRLSFYYGYYDDDDDDGGLFFFAPPRIAPNSSPAPARSAPARPPGEAGAPPADARRSSRKPPPPPPPPLRPSAAQRRAGADCGNPEVVVAITGRVLHNALGGSNSATGAGGRAARPAPAQRRGWAPPRAAPPLVRAGSGARTGARGGRAPGPVPVPGPSLIPVPSLIPGPSPVPIPSAGALSCAGPSPPPVPPSAEPGVRSLAFKSTAIPPAAPPVPAGPGAENSPCPSLPYLRRAPSGRLRGELPRHCRISRPGSGAGGGEPAVQRAELPGNGEWRGGSAGASPGTDGTLLRSAGSPGAAGSGSVPAATSQTSGKRVSIPPIPAPFPLGPAFYPGERNPDLSGATKKSETNKKPQKKALERRPGDNPGMLQIRKGGALYVRRYPKSQSLMERLKEGRGVGGKPALV
ncbi:translation initiation factor IF-2-like [Passer montanus]|uniref:translation initiation factor IF-2-like n=1 Tax=Passer montanus TaxID=9160 RepID=UPI001960DCFB|nr:translation initiation factor IF-2-like [Passer montanus]